MRAYGSRPLWNIDESRHRNQRKTKHRKRPASLRTSDHGRPRDAVTHRLVQTGHMITTTALTKSHKHLPVVRDVSLRCEPGNVVSRSAWVTCTKQPSWRSLTTTETTEPNSGSPGGLVVESEGRLQPFTHAADARTQTAELTALEDGQVPVQANLAAECTSSGTGRSPE